VAEFEVEPGDEDCREEHDEFENVAQDPPTERLLNADEFVAHKLRKHEKRLVEHFAPQMRSKI